MWKPYFSQTCCWQVYKIEHTAMQSPLAVEWPYWRAQWLSMWHRHRMPPFQQVSLSIVCPARAAPIKCKCCYCEGATTAQARSGRPQKHTEWDIRVLKRLVRNNHLSSVATLTEFHIVSGNKVRTRTVHWASWNGFLWPSIRTQA